MALYLVAAQHRSDSPFNLLTDHEPVWRDLRALDAAMREAGVSVFSRGIEDPRRGGDVPCGRRWRAGEAEGALRAVDALGRVDHRVFARGRGRLGCAMRRPTSLRRGAQAVQGAYSRIGTTIGQPRPPLGAISSKSVSRSFSNIHPRGTHQGSAVPWGFTRKPQLATEAAPSAFGLARG